MSYNDEAVIIESRKGSQEQSSAPLAVMACVEVDRRQLCHLATSRVGGSRRTYNALLQEVMCANRVITVAGPILGAPQAVLVLEKLIALGSRAIVVLGWCGSLQSHVGIGDLILPTAAYSEEGTSSHYPTTAADFLPDHGLFTSLREQCRRNSLSVHEGPVWTTDAPLRETVAKVRSYGKKGVLAVEMEMSALFGVAAYRGVRLAGLAVVSDELFTLEWRPGFRSKRFKRSRREATGLILDFCASLPPDLLK